jgi:hypothetical protein
MRVKKNNGIITMNPPHQAGNNPEGEEYMDFSVGQVIKMKKNHPCGENRWEILRVGMDFRLKCLGCQHQIMVPRKTVEKGFRGFVNTTSSL